ncbi:hypothetical protein MUY27_11610 [Mucilaginibacter sp. RS28]|uniref:Uncharacterized protein n=1 Tax=Mucilaginibacter straminoryzae TaxID=2932774 RepID=A0A9X1X3N6_9SPHI|nr:hypothetical protein [Mucilaginibacter straminoryzae]MCJ8210356.1 hypothetical protein [Mucilaginibacter straminoryzae]
MKTPSKTSVTKLINRFDNELMNLLMEDLKAVKSAKNQLMEKIANSVANTQLSAA